MTEPKPNKLPFSILKTIIEGSPDLKRMLDMRTEELGKLYQEGLKLIRKEPVMKVYLVSFIHQIDPEDYGLFSTLEKAEICLSGRMRRNIIGKGEKSIYSTNNMLSYGDGYYITILDVK